MHKISLIIPVYNVEKYLYRCLDSVIEQSFEDWEAICINDGSTDNSLHILQEYSKKDLRIRLISQENAGLSAVRNVGLGVAKGKYICFLDSDDFLDKNYLLMLYNEIEKTNADIVMAPTRYIIGKKNTKDKFKNEVLMSFVDKISALPHGGSCNKLYRTSFFAENNIEYPSGLYWEDNIVTIKCCYFSNKFAIVDGDCYNYICNPLSITRDESKEAKRQKDCLAILMMIVDFLNDINCSYAEKESVLDFCFYRFVKRGYILDNSFYKQLEKIVGKSKILKKHRRKQKTLRFLRSMIFLKY